MTAMAAVVDTMAESETPDVKSVGSPGGVITAGALIEASRARTGEMALLGETLRVLIETSLSLAGTTLFFCENMRWRATHTLYFAGYVAFGASYSEDAAR